MTLETGRPERAAIVLAGGYSTRFGEADKAVADLAGTPMIRRVVDRIEPVVDDLVVNCREEQVPAIREALGGGLEPDASFAIDPIPDRGPMAGITTGLRAASGADAFVVACDMPFVDPDFAAHLFDRAADHEAAVPRLDDQWFQTTQAVYSVEPMLAACERALERDEGRIVEPLLELDYVVVDEDEIRECTALETFENVNTRTEFEGAIDRLGDE
ncbi:molybdenum cofactor guanylyltransferase [Natrinema longum]|uniref:Probable molybdenum cofactor guanylyltransferase n=1 Tax=Natrinema longum TaxID=370324 RepID=A0A8A2UAF2_9EURY|nr:molybdenum cofactor guanylyltransferase [Natrinema longum]MBZ6496360.1 molybdenum cofactor guanylyltransferase [Natrinema longum]QSW85729.1 molybdenum cofactor guanylyltransferase [Natrinema longum]